MIEDSAVAQLNLLRAYLQENTLDKETIVACMKADGKLWSIDYLSFKTRGASMAYLLSRCATPPKSRWFLVNLADKPISSARNIPSWLPVIGSSSAEGYLDIAAPDFSFGGWEELGTRDYGVMCGLIEKGGRSAPQTNLLGWYGASAQHESRARLVEIGARYPRRMEIVDVSFPHGSPEKNPFAGTGLSMDAQAARFRYLIDVEGKGWSARLKYLFHSRRPVLVQDRPWQEWYFPMLKPWVHYVPVKRDFSDLLAALDRLDSDPALAASIGAQGQKFAKQHLTFDNAIAVWSDLLVGRSDASPWHEIFECRDAV